MSRRACKLALVCVAVLAGGGCDHPCPPVVLDTRGVVPAVRYDDLAAVLARAVGKDGLAEGEALDALAARLDAQVKLLAVAGPTATPDLLGGGEARIAYWLNAHTAWSMKLLLIERCPRQVRQAAFHSRPFPLDGRTMTLGGIVAALSKDADFRTAATCPGVTLLDARLPREPFAPETLRKRIADRFAEMIDDPLRFVVNIRRKRVEVPPALWAMRGRAIREHNARYGTRDSTLLTALLPYVTGSPHRRLQDAIGYECVPARSPALTTQQRED